MKTSRNGLKPIPEKQMPEWARAASQAHKRATKKKRAELRQRGLLMIIWKDGKVVKFRPKLPVSKVSRDARPLQSCHDLHTDPNSQFTNSQFTPPINGGRR